MTKLEIYELHRKEIEMFGLTRNQQDIYVSSLLIMYSKGIQEGLHKAQKIMLEIK